MVRAAAFAAVAYMACGQVLADDSFGAQLVECLDRKGMLGKANNASMQKAITDCNTDVNAEMSLLYAYGEASKKWLICVRDNAHNKPPSGAPRLSAEFLAITSCRDQYKGLEAFNLVSGGTSDRLSDANAVIRATLVGDKIVIQNPFPMPKTLP